MNRAARNSTMLWALLVGAAAAEAPVQLAPREAVVVLRSGECLRGRVTEAGDQVLLVAPTAEVRLRREEVDFTCGSLDEACTTLRGRLGPRDLDGRLRLAQWCLRYDQLGAAGQLAVECLQLDPRDPRVERLQRQLELARLPRSEPTPADVSAAGGPSLDELDRLVRELPVGTVELFAQRVQPLLLNHCGTSRCHGPRPEGETWSLLRPPSVKQQGRRVTQRNLHTVLAVAGEAPAEQSPLATVPLGPHGGLPGPVFAPHEIDAYRQLVLWLRVARRPTNETPSRAVAEPASARPKPSTGSAAAATSGAKPVAADPFDPAAFNARVEGTASDASGDPSEAPLSAEPSSTDE